jgi:hypothetical protein
MEALKRAEKPFQFHTRLNLPELTGLRVRNLREMLETLREVSGSCIYHHTHRYLQQHQFLSPEPPNDFAYWVTEILGESGLGEKLASIDTIRYPTIRSLREKIVGTIEEHLAAEPSSKRRFAREGEEFHFIKSVSFIVPTPYEAYDLRELHDILGKVTVDSIYFHMFEARLRLERGENDFSFWIETSLGDKKLAADIARLDPYTRTLDNLRRTIMKLIEQRMPG